MALLVPYYCLSVVLDEQSQLPLAVSCQELVPANSHTNETKFSIKKEMIETIDKKKQKENNFYGRSTDDSESHVKFHSQNIKSIRFMNSLRISEAQYICSGESIKLSNLFTIFQRCQAIHYPLRIETIIHSLFVNRSLYL